MGKKRTIWKKKLFDDASIRSMIFIYFTITALAASVLISLSLYQRMSRQVTEVVQEESQNLIAQVGELHRLAFGIRHGIVQIEGYEGISPVVLRVAIGIVTELYLVRILRIHARNEVDVMHLLTAPETAAAQQFKQA